MPFIKYLLIAIILIPTTSAFAADDMTQEWVKNLETSLAVSRQRTRELNTLCYVQEYTIIKLINPKVLNKQEQTIIENFALLQIEIESDKLNVSLEIKKAIMLKYKFLKERNLLPNNKEPQ